MGKNKEFGIGRATSDVGTYYNRNTKRFLLTGHGGDQLAIRRAVWAPGVTERGDAIQYVNRLIYNELKSSKTNGDCLDAVLDLGCGVGGSMIYLAPRLEADYVGVTISRVQAELGAGFIEQRGLDRVTIEEADYTDPACWAEHADRTFDAAFAIESFIHARDVTHRFPLVVSQLRSGARFIIVDDMISRRGARSFPGRRERRWLREFEKGWYAYGLVSVEQVTAAASEAGLRLVEARDLTPFLELDRPRDLLARLFISGLRWWPLRASWFNNLLGGNALQLALKSGLLGYYYLVFTVERDRTQP